MNTNSVIVTSLPRTGTTSMRQMLDTLGYKSIHTPLGKIFELYGPNVAFSDTPAFAPSIIDVFLTMPEAQNKFVYVDRDFDTWFDSMTKSTNLLQTYQRMASQPFEDLNEGQQVDVTYYGEVFGKVDVRAASFKDHMRVKFFEHREQVSGLGLVYKFNDGWEPLCEYLDLNIPEVEIPHLHKQSIGSGK